MCLQPSVKTKRCPIINGHFCREMYTDINTLRGGQRSALTFYYFQRQTALTSDQKHYTSVCTWLTLFQQFHALVRHRRRTKCCAQIAFRAPHRFSWRNKRSAVYFLGENPMKHVVGIAVSVTHHKGRLKRLHVSSRYQLRGFRSVMRISQTYRCKRSSACGQ